MELQERIAELQKALIKDAYNPKTWVDLAECYLDMGDLPQALTLATEACKLSPDNVGYLALKASIFGAMYRFEEMLATLDEIIALNPENVLTYIWAKEELELRINKVKNEE